jgi:uncharacterized protein YneR
MNAANDIINAVKSYIDTPDTKYAIMIDGDWGCGKTYLWKKTLLPMIGKNESLYISMYGLKDIKDIENEIFKALSFVGSDEDGMLKGFINSNSDIAEDIKIGGIGYAVQFGLKKWKKSRIDKSKNLFVCFDDVERWAGDIEICLSYINKLVEHENAKCLIIGNAEKLKSKNIEIFNESKEKTIKFIYRLSYPPLMVLKAAMSIASHPSTKCKKYVENLLNDNLQRISDLLISVNFSNIRTVSRAIHYLSIIYSRNGKVFDLSPTIAISYFISLLSTLIFVDHFRNNDKDRNIILNISEKDVVRLLDQLDIDIIEKERKLTDEEKIIQDLYHKVFSYSNRIKFKGKFSIIKNGFYKEIDFEEEFSEWKSTEDFEYYIDTFKFWYLDDDNAKIVFDNTYKAMFEDKSITNPTILLSLMDRMLNDIKRGVINLDFKETKIKIEELFDEVMTSSKAGGLIYEPLKAVRFISHLKVASL